MTDTLVRPEPQCAGCGRPPAETHKFFWKEAGYRSAVEYVRNEEGTLDDATGMYLCDTCYIRNGQPATRMGHGPRWTATPTNLSALGL